jgi:hypothetical protein
MEMRLDQLTGKVRNPIIQRSEPSSWTACLERIVVERFRKNQPFPLFPKKYFRSQMGLMALAISTAPALAGSMIRGSL